LAQNAPETIEILRAVGNLALFPSLAAVIIAWLKRHAYRKVILTQNDNQIVRVEGYNSEELGKILEQTRAIAVAATEQDTKTSDPT